jgi:hypothetical protein
VDDLTRIGAQYGHGNFEQPGRPDVSRNWLGAVWRERFNDAWAANVTAGWQWNSFDRAALGPEAYWKDDFNLFTVDGYATWTPRDWMRWDFGLFHGSLTNPDAIFRGISLTELQPVRRLRSTSCWRRPGRDVLSVTTPAGLDQPGSRCGGCRGSATASRRPRAWLLRLLGTRDNATTIRAST